jgi:hypothetical protein
MLKLTCVSHQEFWAAKTDSFKGDVLPEEVLAGMVYLACRSDCPQPLGNDLFEGLRVGSKVQTVAGAGTVFELRGDMAGVDVGFGKLYTQRSQFEKKLLGEGSFGMVFEATLKQVDAAGGTRLTGVAFKVTKHKQEGSFVSEEEDFFVSEVNNMDTEIAALTELRGLIGVLKLVGAFEFKVDGMACSGCVTELAACSVQDVLERFPRFNLSEAVVFFSELTSALGTIHAMKIVGFLIAFRRS